ncbi:CBN-SCL-10 protein [Caenorhabditis brenneri]|uniref:CBN-SCL-10 protein n=1 Tax=Caenorhabditis brenneri TaxID=135651 RepID=G0NTB6_CAEBE|nr:CBN-SCL-10 protein [Caenorhabditis brenneri]
MRQLIWNSTLESSAQEFSNGCPAGHSKNRKNIGENMYWWTSPVVTETDIDLLGNRSSNLWESEFQSSGWTENKLTSEIFNTGIGHATQMAWATSISLGCGVSRCTGGSIEGTEYVVVCQYYPAGNYIGSDIYKSGETCSECPEETACDTNTGLCVQE